MGLIKHRELTTKELEARRRNASKSTGPRTARGKARGSLNALKHAERSRSMWGFLRLFGIRPYANDRLGSKTEISFRFRVIVLATARSIKDSDCRPKATMNAER